MFMLRRHVQSRCDRADFVRTKVEACLPTTPAVPRLLDHHQLADSAFKESAAEEMIGGGDADYLPHARFARSTPVSRDRGVGNLGTVSPSLTYKPKAVVA